MRELESFNGSGILCVAPNEPVKDRPIDKAVVQDLGHRRTIEVIVLSLAFDRVQKYRSECFPQSAPVAVLRTASDKNANDGIRGLVMAHLKQFQKGTGTPTGLRPFCA
jgi:hypothetical protein